MPGRVRRLIRLADNTHKILSPFLGNVHNQLLEMLPTEHPFARPATEEAADREPAAKQAKVDVADNEKH